MRHPRARTSPPAGRLPPPASSSRTASLPFTDVLTAGCLAEASGEIKAAWKDRIFTPLVTLWVFLGQVLSADQSCRAAVARLIAHRVAQGLEPCSSETGAYCQARKRLPERFFSAVARLVGRNLDARVDRRWLWKGRRVCLFDGSTVSMPDTPENRRGVPPGLQPDARDELRHRADRGDHLAVVRGDPRPGHLPLRRQGPGGGQPAAAAVGRAPPRRRAAGRPPDVGLGRHAPAQAARASTPSAACRRTAGPTSARGPAWARTTTSSSGRSRRRSARWTGGRTTRCPTRSRSARSASGWSSRGSGPGRSSS